MHHVVTWKGLGRALRDIQRTQGYRGLFRGHSTTLLKIYPYAALNYVAYEQYRVFLIRHKDQETWTRRFLAGALAGATSVFFTYPLDLLRVRLAFETGTQGSSLTSMIRTIQRERATTCADTSNATLPLYRTLANFYRGFPLTIAGILPYAGVSFSMRDSIGDLLRAPSIQRYTTLPGSERNRPGQRAPLRAWAELTSGGLAGAVAQTVTYPLEVIRRRMQVGGAVGDGHYLSIRETMGVIFRERGISGFFVGLSIGYVKVVPMVTVSFYTYEKMILKSSEG